jgi:hypothetical protein
MVKYTGRAWAGTTQKKAQRGLGPGWTTVFTLGLARHDPKIFWALLARTRLARSTMGLGWAGPTRPNSQHYLEADGGRRPEAWSCSPAPLLGASGRANGGQRRGGEAARLLGGAGCSGRRRSTDGRDGGGSSARPIERTGGRRRATE